MKLFTKSFWATAFENAVVAGAAAFAGSGLFTTPPHPRNFAAAGIAAGMAALYSFVKALGGVQSVNALPKS
jgi:predicted transcriptional regulator